MPCLDCQNPTYYTQVSLTSLFTMKLTLILLSLLSGIFFIQVPTDSLPDRSHTVAFVHVNVIPMTQENLVLKNQTVVVTGGQIREIRPTRSEDLKEGERFELIIDGSGKYLMPGLSEMHGHIPPTNPSPNAPAYFDDYYVESTLFLYVAAGVTTVRGMLGYDHQLDLKERVGIAGNWELVGPRLYLAGPSFNGNTVSSPDQARARVLQQESEGWDLLKIHPGLTLAEFEALADAAHAVEIPFGGHVPADVGLINALRLGQQTIDHIDGYVEYLSQFEGAELDQKIDEVISMTRDNEVWIIPTQALWETILGVADYDALRNYDELKYIPKQVRNNYNQFIINNIDNNPNLDLVESEAAAALRQELLYKMNAAGVKILMGTDAPQLFSVPGFSIHRELAKMSESGMSNYDILRSGTSNVGEYIKTLGVRGEYGTIQVNSSPDMILLDKNPLDDIHHVSTLSGVFIDQRWLSRDAIDSKLSEIEAHYSGN